MDCYVMIKISYNKNVIVGSKKCRVQKYCHWFEKNIVREIAANHLYREGIEL